MTLLQEINREQLAGRERQRQEVRQHLREVLRRTIPGRRVFVFGSLICPERFTEESDIDLALESDIPEMSIYQLISLLSEQLGRTVDVILLDECRFRDRILKEGELWTLQV